MGLATLSLQVASGNPAHWCHIQRSDQCMRIGEDHKKGLADLDEMWLRGLQPIVITYSC